MTALSLVSAAAALGGWLLLLRHALSRSVGTLALVLLLPGYAPWYAFSQFEHLRKGAVLAAWLGGHGLCAMALAHRLSPPV
jgi:hypothetical protein